MSTSLAVNELSAIETVLIQGDLMKFTAPQRISYYKTLCESAGINPLTRPFDYLTLNGKLVLYANRGCTDQLRKVHSVSITKLEISDKEGLRIVTAYACDASGRTDASIGAVCVDNMRGLELANAYMKAETKAKRRVTLSICGLGVLDESEVDDLQVDSKPRRVVMEDSMPQTLVSHTQAEPQAPQIASGALPEANSGPPAELPKSVIPTEPIGADPGEAVLEDVRLPEGNRQFAVVKWKGRDHSVWDAKLFDGLVALKGKPVVLYTEVKGKYSNVLSFELPAIQREFL